MMATRDGRSYQLNNGVIMPSVGLGVFHSGPEQTVAAVSSAIEGGYRLIDTAAFYMNETQVGEGIRASGLPRDELFVTTKVWMTDYGFERTLEAFDRSLRKLRLDVLDLYLIHWPVPTDFETTVSAYRAAMKLLDDGRVRAVGVSNFRPADLDALISRTGHVPAINQVELHPFFNQSDLREVNKRLGIITQAWSPIGGVNRYGMKAAKEALPDPLSHPIVLRLARKYNKTPAQIILRWQLELGNSPVPKSVRRERIIENFNIFDFNLAQGEVSEITALDTGVRGGPDPALVTPQSFPAVIPD
jgi:diketogulonate reductase-like aldo/keto reductase